MESGITDAPEQNDAPDGEVDAVVEPVAIADGLRSDGDTGPPGTGVSPKKSKKLLKDGEERLRHELNRYREIAKKVKHAIGPQPVLAEREKVKKAEWMLASIKHYLKEIEKKAPGIGSPLTESFHESVSQSVGDLKAARKRLKLLRKERNDSDDTPEG